MPLYCNELSKAAAAAADGDDDEDKRVRCLKLF